MKDKYMWDPERERILDMKHKKSYSRADFPKVFEILVKTDRRKEDLRRMASKSHKEYKDISSTVENRMVSMKSSFKTYYVGKIREAVKDLEISNAEKELEIRKLREKNRIKSIDISSLEDRIKQYKTIIEESESKEEIIKKVEELHFRGEEGFDQQWKNYLDKIRRKQDSA